MTSHRSRVAVRLAGAIAFLTISVCVSQAQAGTDKSAALDVPHTVNPVLFDCGAKGSAGWEKVHRVSLSKEAATIMRVDAKKPLALEFLRSDPSSVVAAVPAAPQSKLDSFHGQYEFQWDENSLYGYVEIKEQDLDSRHSKTSEKAFRRSPYEAAFDDMFHSSAVVEVGAPSWQRWVTEMHVHVRPPNAKPLASVFFGRTNDEEKFRELDGHAVACPIDGGWIAKFAVAWLPFGDWRPKPGVTASLKLVAPLPYSNEGYVLVDIVPFVLTK
jgi:hypothetical protein